MAFKHDKSCMVKTGYKDEDMDETEQSHLNTITTILTLNRTITFNHINHHFEQIAEIEESNM